jgi:hypothetical protein
MGDGSIANALTSHLSGRAQYPSKMYCALCSNDGVCVCVLRTPFWVLFRVAPVWQNIPVQDLYHYFLSHKPIRAAFMHLHSPLIVFLPIHVPLLMCLPTHTHFQFFVVVDFYGTIYCIACIVNNTFFVIWLITFFIFTHN